MTAQFPAIGEARRDENAPGLLLGPISHLALEKKTWNPVLLAGVLWRAACNVGRHRQVREVLKYREYIELAQSNPRFAFKYLTHGYLSRRLSVAQRANCFTHHYRVMHHLLPESFISTILSGDINLVQLDEAETCYSISFGLSRTHDKEGELSLNLEVDGKTLFIMSFTIVPGKVVQSPAPDVLFITRIQGVKGCYAKISEATRRLHDVAPPALLLAALQGIGEALGIRALACITGTDQNSYCEEYGTSFSNSYDNFFTELGVEKNAAGLFVSEIPIKEKPLTVIKPGHKLRTREKREFKRDISDKVREFLSENRQGLHPSVQRMKVEQFVEQL